PRGGEELARDLLEVLDRDALRTGRVVVDAERTGEVARLGEDDVDVLRKRVYDRRLQAKLDLVEHRVQLLPFLEASHAHLARPIVQRADPTLAPAVPAGQAEASTRNAGQVPCAG